MLRFVKVRNLLRNLFSSRRAEADLDQEVQSHLEMLIEENIRVGMSPKEAQRAARIEFGGIEQVKEQVREERLGNWLRSVISDCRYGVRQLGKNPGFTAVAVLTLILGIGANTAIFSFADLLLNHPVSLQHLNRLVSVDEIRSDGEEAPLSAANFHELRAETESLESFNSYQEWTANLGGSNGAEESRGVRVGEDFFTTSLVQPFSASVADPLQAGKAMLCTKGPLAALISAGSPIHISNHGYAIK
jgi:putative ABC transport system permease protein